jgi:hypothetical protein
VARTALYLPAVGITGAMASQFVDSPAVKHLVWASIMIITAGAGGLAAALHKVRQTRPDHARQLAIDLFAALAAEAGEWADDSEITIVENLDELPRDEALSVLAEHNLVPSQLLGPVEAVLDYLDPQPGTN